MSEETRPRQEEGWVLVGRGARLRGGRGLLTVRLAPSTAYPLRPGQVLRFRRENHCRDLRIENAEHYRDRVILQLEGIGSATLAEPLVGSDIFLQSKDLVDLPEGTYYIFRLVGLEVRTPGKGRLGRVADVLRTGGTDLLLVRGEGDREILIPFAHAICRRVDIDGGFIEIDPPEGLLEIDAV
jgi:16S rRNA processing protein RimM